MQAPMVGSENSSIFSLQSLTAIAQEALALEAARASEGSRDADVIDLKRPPPGMDRLTPTPVRPVTVPVLPLGIQPLAPEPVPPPTAAPPMRARWVGPTVAGSLIAAGIIAAALIVTGHGAPVSGVVSTGAPARQPPTVVPRDKAASEPEGRAVEPGPPPQATTSAAPTSSSASPPKRPPNLRRPTPPAPTSTSTAPKPSPASGACGHCGAGDLDCFMRCKAG